MTKFLEKDSNIKILSAIIAALLGLLVGFVIMFIIDPGGSFLGMFYLITGGLTDGISGIGNVLYYATPIILTGLSVAFAFKTGLFNIGASGQMMMGGTAAVFVGVNLTIPAPFHWIVALLAGVLAGAIWGMIPGLLKAFRNVHEVVSTIMLNYIAAYLMQIIMVASFFDSSKNESKAIADTAIIPSMGMDKLFPGSPVSGGFIIAVVAAIIIYIVLEKTTFGYELKAVGHNKEAAKYAGINEKKSIVLSMVIAGALAGLAGSVYFLSDAGVHLRNETYLLTQGFDGITVALLAFSSPLAVVATGIFIGHLTVGGLSLPLASFAYSSDVVSIVLSAVVYFMALSMLLRKFLLRKNEKGGNA